MKRRWDDNLSTTRRWCVYHPCPETRNNLVRSISRKFLLHFSRPVGDWLVGCEGISPGRGTKRKIEGDGDRLRVPDRHRDNLPPPSLSLSGRSPRTVNSMDAKLVNCSELMTKSVPLEDRDRDVFHRDGFRVQMEAVCSNGWLNVWSRVAQSTFFWLK